MRPARPARPAHGLSLLEALIAATVLVLGLVGLMRMQAQLVTASTDAQLRYTAMQLADEHLNLVRIDPANAACYTLPATGTCGSAAATAHTTAWAARVAQALPGTVSSSVSLNTSTHRMQVSIGWTGRQAQSAGAARDPRLLTVETDVRR